MGVPGHLVRSFATDENGVSDLGSGISLVNHRTPLEERWGGWYVTGTHGKQTHQKAGSGLATAKNVVSLAKEVKPQFLPYPIVFPS